MQTDADGTKHAIEYYSKQLTETECKYAAVEREALGVVRALSRFRSYLLMAPTFEIVVRNDHRGLTPLYRHADESSRLYRWAAELNEFDFVVRWMRGTSEDAKLPDGLSRARVLCSRAQIMLQQVHANLQAHAVPTDQPTHTVDRPTAQPRGSDRGPPTGYGATQGEAQYATPTSTHTTTLLVPTPCTKTVGCTKAQGHLRRCQVLPAPNPAAAAQAPDADHGDDGPAADSEPTYDYDHIVCRAKRDAGGKRGFRVRWRGCTAEEDTYELIQKMRCDLTGHMYDALVVDFVRRERTGDVDATLAIPDGYEGRWTNVISATAPTPMANPTHTPPLSPFPTAIPTSDAGFRSFSGVTLPQLLQHQQLEPDTADFSLYLADDTYRPPALSPSKQAAWQRYAKTVYRDDATNLLMRKFVGNTGPHVGRESDVIVLPATLLQHAYDWAHALSGHSGVGATMWCIRTRFHCHRLEERLRTYVQSCSVCMRAARDKRPAEYGEIPIGTFGQAIGFDFCGPFMAVGSKKETCLCIMVDHATKYLVVCPTEGETAADAVEALTHWILTVGTIPECIYSDRGGFTGKHKIFAALLKRFNIRHQRTMGFSPQGDSNAEACVKNTNRILRKVIEGHPTCWPEASAWATYCYNTKYHTTIGTSPFYACHGTEPRMPIDFLLPRTTSGSHHITLAELSDRIDRINEAVQAGVDKLHARNAVRNDTLARVREFAAGDLVWKERRYPGKFTQAGIDTKWFVPYQPEPYLVLERRSAQHSRIRLAHDDEASYEDVHHQRLKHCTPHEDAIQFNLAVPLPDGTDNNDSDSDSND
jgi:hypothetical protein